MAGEIIETLWSPLNHTASSARTMTWYHRQEYLDAHMGDSNWKKVVTLGRSELPLNQKSQLNGVLVPSLYRRWQVAVKQAADSAAYFEDLCTSVGPEYTRQWTDLEERMQQDREDNLAVMDQLDVADGKGEFFVVLF